MLRIVRGEQQDFGYELFIAADSVLAVFNNLIFLVPGADPDAVNVVLIVNAVLTLPLLFDFDLRLATAPSRSSYLLSDWGWADLLTVIPQFRVFRLFRIFKAWQMPEFLERAGWFTRNHPLLTANITSPGRLPEPPPLPSRE